MNSSPPTTKMRKLILTGTYAQYRDWLVLHKANPRAALYIHQSDQFYTFDPDDCEIVLDGTYWDNPAYQSAGHLWFNSRQLALAS